MLSSQWVIDDAKELSVKEDCLYKAVPQSMLLQEGQEFLLCCL